MNLVSPAGLSMKNGKIWIKINVYKIYTFVIGLYIFVKNFMRQKQDNGNSCLISVFFLSVSRTDTVGTEIAPK